MLEKKEERSEPYPSPTVFHSLIRRAYPCADCNFSKEQHQISPTPSLIPRYSTSLEPPVDLHWEDLSPGASLWRAVLVV